MSPSELKQLIDESIDNTFASIKQRFITSAKGVEVIIGSNQHKILSEYDRFTPDSEETEGKETVMTYRGARIRVVARPNHFSCNMIAREEDVSDTTES